MDTEKKKMLSDFAIKAAQRLEDKKITKYATLFVPSLDENIKIRSLNRKEVIECMNVEDTKDDPDRSDNYTLYLSVVEPNLKEVAKELKEQGKIVEYLEVCNIFEMHERVSIAQEIMRLSGVIGTQKVAAVNEIKN